MNKEPPELPQVIPVIPETKDTSREDELRDFWVLFEDVTIEDINTWARVPKKGNELS